MERIFDAGLVKELEQGVVYSDDTVGLLRLAAVMVEAVNDQPPYVVEIHPDQVDNNGGNLTSGFTRVRIVGPWLKNAQPSPWPLMDEVIKLRRQVASGADVIVSRQDPELSRS